MKDKFKIDFMPPEKLKKAIDEVYLSKMFVDELRTIFAEFERKQYIARQNKYKFPQHCIDSQSAICFKRLAKVPYSMQDNSVSVFRTKSLFSGIKFDHFVKPLKGVNNDSKSSESYSGPSESVDSSQDDVDSIKKGTKDYIKIDSLTDAEGLSPIRKQPIIITTTVQNPYDSEEVLMERQKHNCVYSRSHNKNEEYMELKGKLLKELYKAEQDYLDIIEGDSPQPRRSHHHNQGLTHALEKNGAKDVVKHVTEQYSFDEDDKTITDMLDHFDRTKTVMHSPPAGSMTQSNKRSGASMTKSNKRSGSSRKSDMGNSRMSSKTELEELELLALHEARSRRATNGLRKIENEMQSYQPREPAGGRIFSQNNTYDGDEDDHDLFLTLANKEDLNKLNILHRLSQQQHQAGENEKPSLYEAQ